MIPTPTASRFAWVASATLATALCALATTASRADEPAPPMPPAATQQLAHDIFRELIEIRSVKDVGTAGAAQAVAARLRAAGFPAADVHVLPEKRFPQQVNVVVRVHGRGAGKPVLWICHLDVVEAKPADWSVPPFKFTAKDGYFYGRGTSDMKDSDAAVLTTLIRLKQEGYVPDRDIIVAFTADEESEEEQNGVLDLLHEHPELISAGLVVNPDGSSGELQHGKRLDFAVETSQKTYVTFTAEAFNKGGHSSEPRPDNAIYELANALVRLSVYQFPFKTNATTRLYFADLAQRESGDLKRDLIAVSQPQLDLAAAARLARNIPLNSILHSTCVATMLAAGHAENALPQRAQATIQCRIMPDETVATTHDALAKAIGDPGIKLTVIPPVTQAPESPPSAQLLGTVEQVVHSMWPGVLVIPQMGAGASDSVFTRNAGMPSYGISGAWEDIDDIRAHGRDERISQSAFYQSVEFTYRLMKALTGGASAHS
jgi:acetylornithine deacetylase/succinyl-diaminopimelate desuccinylase-like protein